MFSLLCVKARSVGLPVVPLEARLELALNLEKETGLKVISIKDDNNCVFRALAHLVFEGDDEAHADVRDAVCNELEADPGGVYSERFTPRIGDYREDGSYAQHVTRMRRLEEWGGEPELRAAASIFGFQIHVYHPFLNDGVQVIQAPAEKQVEKAVDVHLLYYGDHYDVAYHESRPFNSELRKRRKMEKAEIIDGHSTVGLVVKDDMAAAPDSAEDAAAALDEAVTGDGLNSGQAGSVDNSEGGDGDVGNGDIVACQKRYKNRGEGKTGHRLSSNDEDLRSRLRLPGLGLSKSSKSSK